MAGKKQLRIYLSLITLIGVIVPRGLRTDWRQEWEAELRHREALLVRWEKLNWRAKLNLFWRGFGSLWDALCLQPQRLEDEMFQDLRYGVRMLLNKPGFTLVAVLTLALGIGANTSIFSVVNAVMLRPLAYQKSDELVMFWFENARGQEQWLWSPAAHLNLKSQNSVFTDVAAWGNDTWPANLTGDSEPQRLPGFQVSANFFEVLGVAAAQGRTFLAEEENVVNNHVVVISDELWRRQFGSDRGMMGRSIMLNGAPYEVIGVMPSDFSFIMKTDVWTPLALSAGLPSDRDTIKLHQVARLKPGVATEQARGEVDELLRPYIKNGSSDLRATLKPLQAVLEVNQPQMLLPLFAAVGFVLLIACVNVSNLLVAHASVRRKELAIRAAMGAGRPRLVRQLLTENLVLALLGGASGLLVANWGIRFLVGDLPDWAVDRNSHIAALKLDGSALGYTLALSLLTTAIFGLIPVFHASRVNLNEALKEGGRSNAQARGQNRFRSFLVVSEISLAMVLLVGAGLMIKSFWRISHANRGFDSTGVLTAKVDPLGERYRDHHQVLEFYRQLLERVSSIPGVAHVGITNGFLDSGWGVAIEEHAPVPAEERPAASRHPVSADFFQAMRIPLRAGRFFTDRDASGAPPIAIIDEEFQRRHFPNENAIGKHLRFEDTLREIVGVVGATRGWKPYSFSADEEFPRVYLPYQQEKVWATTALMVRAQSGDPMRFEPAIRRELAEIAGDQPIYSFEPLEQSVSKLSADRRFSTLLLTVFAAIAAVLAAIGIYGVMSYTVAQRKHEIGIRMALGAQAGDVLKLVIRQALALVLAGIAIGLAGALALTRVLANLLFGVRANDPLTFVGISLALAAVALLACWIPAHRAMKVDPMIALRHE
jgi:putative ABC transport system permease protein